MTTWASVYQDMVRECLAAVGRLTEWEEEFLKSIQGRLDDGVPLSAKQTEILDRIHGKVTNALL